MSPLGAWLRAGQRVNLAVTIGGQTLDEMMAGTVIGCEIIEEGRALWVTVESDDHDRW